MSWELYYTSANRGLRPHSRGFCTVARTDGMPSAVVERLESLSSYQPIYPGGSALADRNPVAWSHWKIPVGSRNRSVLSRVAFVGSDYTGRPSKFAHHVLLEPAEQAQMGPAGMMLSEWVMRSTWEGEPTLLESRPLEGTATADPPIASDNRAWPARLAEAFREEPERPAYVIYEPQIDLLPMLNAAIQLLPLPARWQVTFSTYFTDLPAGLNCAWRCVVAGTPAAAAARGAMGFLIDLTANSHPAH
jgi:hypothetical protein